MNVTDYKLRNLPVDLSTDVSSHLKSIRPFARLGLLILLLNISCVAQNNSSSGSYEEDISSLRPRFTTPLDSQKKDPVVNYHTLNVTPAKNVNRKVDLVLDSINKINLTRRFVDGFTIQIYSGQNREEAAIAKKKLLDVQNMSSNLKYEQPKFRVTAGSYFTRLDAQRDLTRIRRSFTSAILVPERILIK